MAARRCPTPPGQLTLFMAIPGGLPAVPEPPPLTEAAIDAMFAEWWREYPKRVAVKAARKAFGAVIKSGEATLSELIEGAQRYAEECRRRGEPKYTAHGATWLNAGRWLDERQPAYSPATASAARVGLEYRARAGVRR